MGKAKAHPGQLGFDFTAPAPVKDIAGLAGFERQVNAVVGSMLNSDPRNRYEIAGAMSALLDEDISKAMLDAYSSPAREDHRVPFSRLAALAIVTDRQDLLRPLMEKLGVGMLIGDEVKVARIGQLDRTIAEAKAEKRTLEKSARRIHELRGDDC
jgi:hypothetical protein